MRPRYPQGDSKHNAFTSNEQPQDVYAVVRLSAKQRGVTLDDEVRAMFISALSTGVPDRLSAKRRREIAIASVINLRGELEPGGLQVFGQFLSSFLVSHLVPPGTTLEKLARYVHAQPQRVKGRKLYLQTL